VYYNPANLTRIAHPSLSVSGSTYLRYEISVDPLLVLEGQDQPFSASGFVAIPSTVTSTYRLGSWRFATAILVPEALEYKDRVTFTTPSVRASVLQQRSYETLWLGGSIARELTPSLSLGLSLFASRDTVSSFVFTRIQIGENAAQETISSEDTTVYNASAVLGVYWEPMPALGVGLRVHSPTVRLAGTSDFYDTALTVGEMNQIDERSIDGAEAAAPLPTDLSLGIAIRPRAGLELVADVGVQLPETITTLNNPVAGLVQQKLELAPRVGIGAELAVTDHVWVRLGGLYNQSAAPSPDSADDTARETYLGITGGLSFQGERTATSIGGFGLFSESEVYVLGAEAPRRSNAHTRLYGGMLAFSYRL
jgi:hypothetical protein